jgi:O-antigen biosynthesis protein
MEGTCRHSTHPRDFFRTGEVMLDQQSRSAAASSRKQPDMQTVPDVDGKGYVAIITPDIVGPIKNGGIGTACFHYARTLANAGYRVDVLFSNNVTEKARSHWKAWYAKRGITFLTLDDCLRVTVPLHGCRWAFERALRIMAFLRQRNYDYLIFQDWYANGFWTARARQLGAGFGTARLGLIAHSPNQWQKAGMQSLGSAPVDEAALEWGEKETIAAVDVLISPSHHMIEWLRDHGYKLPERVAVCPYSFEDPTVRGSPEIVDRDHLIFFGRLETRKGLHLFGSALRNLMHSGAQLPRKISFLGKLAEVEGRPANDYLQDLQADLGSVEFNIETNFDYMQAVGYIRRSNGVVVIPSILDNYPLTVIESIANGFCFLASDAGGIPEMTDPAVRFPATVEGLQRKLAELPRIDFTKLSHLYDPNAARATWLAHVEATVAEVRRMPRVQVLREEIPPISVCVPFHRHDKYLPRMVGGFLAMNLPRLQLVLVDDGTPACERTTFNALRQELEPLGHIFHSRPNTGPGAARNCAASLASHDLLLFFDADNCPFPVLVERLWTAMARAGADSVCAPYVGVPAMAHRPLPEDVMFKYIPPGGPVALGLAENVVGDTCSLMRRSVFDALGGFTDRRSAPEDWEFFLRVVAFGFRHYVYPDPLFYYTVAADSWRSKYKDYDTKLSLYSCLSQFPPGVASEVARIFAAQYQVSGHRR